MSVLVHNLGAFGTGFRLTLALTLASFAGALAIGVVVASMRVSPVAPLRAAGTLYVETIRNIPLLVLMFLFFFGFPKIGIRYLPFPSAVIVLAAYTGAFVAEAIRSGVNTVAQGQAEAARAIGLVAPIGNIFVALIKNTSLALTIAVMELGFQYQNLIAETAQAVPISVGIVVCYLALALSAGWLFSVLEHRVAMKR